MRQALPLLLAAGTVLLLGACDAGTPTAPAATPLASASTAVCSPSSFVSAAAAVAGRQSKLVDLAKLVTNQNAGTNVATGAVVNVFAELAGLADAGHAAGTWTSQNSTDGANLTVLGLACGTFSLTGDADHFKEALDASGLYEVRGGTDDAGGPALAHDGKGGVAAPAAGFGTWLSGRGLFYGYPISTFSVEQFGGYAMDISLARPVFGSEPAALVGAGVVALCPVNKPADLSDAGLRITKTSHILPVASSFLDCTAPSANVTRTTASGLHLALAAASGGVGGTIRNFSPHEVVFPGSVNLSFVAQPVGGTSGKLLTGTDGNALAVKVTGQNGTPWEGVRVQLTVQQNKASYIAVCGDVADTDEHGIATFPSASVNKPGGFQLIAHTVAPEADSDVDAFRPDSVVSAQFNMKNGNAPTTCQ
ncbi:MAG TPA: hypothetical protein VFI41_01795 [Gemmatimonadales bacterium]|jgi:hypothetical protein|nr:hypothetical protein [Gemmatimonadales bacterium]